MQEKKQSNSIILTIAIPTYNAEMFIGKNLGTFIDSRLENRIEVLIINDGSKDNTSIIAHKIQGEYPAIFRVIDKENGGHGSGINKGIEEAQGKYFKVVDSDDWMHTGNLVKLVEYLERTDSDIVLNPFIDIDQSSGRQIIKCQTDLSTGVYSYDAIVYSKVVSTIHTLTIKTSLLIDNCLSFTEHCFYEDFQYNTYPLLFCETIDVLDYPVYYYLTGQKNQSVNNKSALKNIGMMTTVLADTIKFVTAYEEQMPKERANVIKNRIAEFIRSIYNVFLRNSKEEDILVQFDDIDEKIRQISPYYYDYVAKQFRYIALMRLKSKLILIALGKLFGIYKAI